MVNSGTEGLLEMWRRGIVTNPIIEINDAKIAQSVEAILRYMQQVDDTLIQAVICRQIYARFFWAVYGAQLTKRPESEDGASGSSVSNSCAIAGLD